MKYRNFLTFAAITCFLALSASAADTSVTLSSVHLCCPSCVKGVAAALTPVSGAKGVCDQDAGTIVITAPDHDTAQKAVDALVAAGYFGKSSDDSVKVAAPSGAKDGKVQTLEVGGVHLCCNKCVTAVKDVLGKVDGVKSDTVARRVKSFTVTGDFEPKSLFEKLNAEGLAGKVSIAPTTKPAN